MFRRMGRWRLDVPKKKNPGLIHGLRPCGPGPERMTRGRRLEKWTSCIYSSRKSCKSASRANRFHKNVSQTFFPEIRRALSSERFESYDHSGSDSDEKMLTRYLWNMALCRSLYPALQGLEIALRNSIHHAISSREGTDWWFRKRHSVVQGGYGKSKVGNAIRRVRESSNPLTPGRVIAELSFGFWTSLFNRRYDQDLWPSLLKDVFPDAPRKIRTTKFMRSELNKMRNLRNRVFHHEPIWHWSDLDDKHEQLLNLIEWICPAWRTTIEIEDRFPTVYNEGISPFESSVEDAVDNHSP